MQLSCGLYGPALLMKDDLWGTLENIKRCGFSAVEPFVLLDWQKVEEIPSRRVKFCIWSADTILEMKPRMKKLGLEISSAHVGFLEKTAVECIDDLMSVSKKTGIKHFIFSPMLDELKLDKAAALALDITEANLKLNPLGITLSIHNHDMEFHSADTEYGRISVMEYIMKKSGPCVTAEIDTGWAVYGGGDPVKFIREYKDRIIAVHFKDINSNYSEVQKEEAFCSIGDGIVDHVSVMELLSELDLFPYGVMIDQDNASKGGDLISELKKGVNYILGDAY